MELLTCHKRRLRNVSIFVFLISLTFVIYQITFIATIDSSDKSSIVDLKPRVQVVTNETFRCRDGLIIDLYKFNDDYCDCQDGSDEPETNACINSEFVCQHESNIARIPSGWVNDGICDCCDGSDEYLSIVSPIKLTLSEQNKIGRFLTPCVNFCTS